MGSLLKVAVFGTGNAGMHHLNALSKIHGVRPLAVPLRPKRLSELKSIGFETAQSLKHAAENGARACVIATETVRHAADASAALKLGLDVLIEKPLAANAGQARKVLALAALKRRKGYVGCVLRFSESLNYFRELLGQIGRLHSVRIECKSYLPLWRPQRPYRKTYSARAEDGGVLRDLIHEIDYAGWLFGWPKAVYGLLGNIGRLKIAADERAEILWENGPVSVFVGLDYLTRPTRRQILACGEKGTLEWDHVAQTVTIARAGKSPISSPVPQPRESLYLSQARAFLETLAGRPDKRLATLQDGFRALAVCDAARVSAKTHRREVVRA